MKVIDLLNKIANWEKVPELVKYNGIIYNYVAIYRHGMRYIDLDETDENFKYLMLNVNNLNDEIEIIEDTPKDNKIEKLNEHYYHDEPALIDDMAHKINEIIDRLNGEDNERI